MGEARARDKRGDHDDNRRNAKIPEPARASFEEFLSSVSLQPSSSGGEAMRRLVETKLSLFALRADLEPVVAQLVLPVLAIKLPLKVFVVNDNRFFLVTARDATGLRDLIGG